MFRRVKVRRLTPGHLWTAGGGATPALTAQPLTRYQTMLTFWSSRSVQYNQCTYNSENRPLTPIPNQASFWDHYSFRSPETGSWFIQSLCSAIDSSPPDESLMDILMGVSRHVALNKVNI